MSYINLYPPTAQFCSTLFLMVERVPWCGGYVMVYLSSTYDMLTIYQWFTCSCFLITVALAMAELGSAAPTAGGLYYWTFKFSSPRYRKLLSWLIGCTDTASIVCGCPRLIFMSFRCQYFGLHCWGGECRLGRRYTDHGGGKHRQ